LIVVDASVLANALADSGPDGNAARAALREDTDLAAPDLVDVETVSVWRKRWLAGDLTAQRFRTAIADLSDLPMDRHPTLPLMFRAYGLRNNVSPYDAAYIALAELLECRLVTADARIARAPGIQCEVSVVSV
jgi:predicted nucleic acid-binding protein